MLKQQFLSFILKLIILLFKIIVSKVCIINKFVSVDVNLGLDFYFFLIDYLIQLLSLFCEAWRKKTLIVSVFPRFAVSSFFC